MGTPQGGARTVPVRIAWAGRHASSRGLLHMENMIIIVAIATIILKVPRALSCAYNDWRSFIDFPLRSLRSLRLILSGLLRQVSTALRRRQDSKVGGAAWACIVSGTDSSAHAAASDPTRGTRELQPERDGRVAAILGAADSGCDRFNRDARRRSLQRITPLV